MDTQSKIIIGILVVVILTMSVKIYIDNNEIKNLNSRLGDCYYNANRYTSKYGELPPV